MARRQVAPALRALLADLRAEVKPGKEGAGDSQVLRVVEDEVRAVLGVVRVAEQAGPYHWRRDDLAMGRALARLSRVSRKGERNG